MFNLAKLIEGMTPTGWIITVICLLIWVAAIHSCGKLSEQHWGDRESGALIGFFAPGLAVIALLYLL